MGIRSVALISVLALATPVALLDAREQWGAPGLQQAYNEGYQRGVRSGEDDGRRGESFNYTDESDFRRADAGYRREYGNVEWYRNEFRRGFETGYRAGYDRYGYDRRTGRQGPPPWSNGRGNGQYGRNDDYGRYNQNDLAVQTGFNDGYERGLDDGRDRRRNDPIGESRYRSGDHGYDRRYGSREAYKINYREAFRQGYARGYNDARRYDNSRPRWWPF
jgi:flagellar biosynthesis/type III secretory pathway protein FliH